MITQERLKELLRYEEATGVFTRKISRGGCPQNMVAGTLMRGYRSISLDGVRHKAHRLAWLYVYGAIPSMEIDHINRQKDDNRVANLRLVTRKQNVENSVQPLGSSGLRGASWCKRAKKWAAQIRTNRRNKFLGYFATKEEAHEAYKRAASVYHTHNPEVA